MEANLQELNLNLSPVQAPKTISEFLKEISVINDFCEKSFKVNEYVRMLEDELRKIHGFKSEIPLCMTLLKDAIERLAGEKMQGKETEVRHGNSEDGGGAKTSSESSDKKDWLSSAKLWSADINCVNYDIKKQDSGLDLKSREGEDVGSAIKNRFELCNFRSREGAFVPFMGSSSLAMKEEREVLAVDDGSSLSTPVAEMDLNLDLNNKTSCVLSMVTDQTKQAQTKPLLQHHHSKKQRRCWTPELHRRFVHAIQQLEEANATPKHIRALMGIDGLTNDEVKSHLQKYRLHLRRVQKISSATTSHAC